MKIGRLKRKADAAAADARAKRLEYRTHASRSVALVRRRAGSPAGLAISFSIGFMARTGTSRTQNGAVDDDRGITYKVVHGPVGESAIKLATALAARSLLHAAAARMFQAGLALVASGPPSDGSRVK